MSDRASARGGADVHLLSVIRAQREHHKVMLAVGRQDGTVAPPCPLEIIAGLDGPGGAEVERMLDALCMRFQPDVIHMHNALGVLGWAARRGAVVTVQDHRSFCPGQGKLTLLGSVCGEPMGQKVCADCFEDGDYFRRIYQSTQQRLASLSQVLCIIVLSEYMKRELVAAGLEASRITVVPPFVDGLDPGVQPNGPPCVLFAGRLVAAKGAHLALEAWRRSGVALPLVMAGTGSMRAALSVEACELLGWVPHAEMAPVYRRARVLVMPSRWQEPFGIVGLEALHMGVPVAAFDSGGVAEWHPGPGLVPWGDVDALAAAIRELLGASDIVPRHSFAPPMLMRRLLGAYTEMISHRAVLSNAQSPT